VVIEDGELSVAERPDPEPGKGEVLVKVHGAGINGADLLQRRGRYPAPPGSPPDIPGLELAGEVLARGPSAERFSEGDRVAAIVGGGGQAELCTVHERGAMRLPDGLDWPAAGGFAEVFTTAHDALFTQAGLKAGERLLVHGGAGGVGTAAVQLGRACGAQVTATVRREEARPDVERLGATAIDPEGFAEQGPFDVILELVGAPHFPANLDVLAIGGRIIIVGVSAGATVELDLSRLMRRRALIRGTVLRARPLEAKAVAVRAFEREVVPLLADGRVHARVDVTFPAVKVHDAFDRLSERSGKVLLEFS
jgi:putative PIG3 family NAD(P)H quinone oxidoreductase